MNDFSEKCGIEIVECSAKNSNKVSFAFEKMTAMLISNRERNEVKKGYNLDTTPLEGKFAEKKCC